MKFSNGILNICNMLFLHFFYMHDMKELIFSKVRELVSKADASSIVSLTAVKIKW